MSVLNSFDDVVTQEEYRILKRFKKNDISLLTQTEFTSMKKRGFVRNSLSGSSGFYEQLPESGEAVITDVGKRAREKYKKLNKTDMRSRIALVFSAISLLISLGQLLLHWL